VRTELAGILGSTLAEKVAWTARQMHLRVEGSDLSPGNSRDMRPGGRTFHKFLKFLVFCEAREKDQESELSQYAGVWIQRRI